MTKTVAILGTGPVGLATGVWLCWSPSISRSVGSRAADQLAARAANGTEIARLVNGGRVQLESGFQPAAIPVQRPRAVVAEDRRRIAMDELVMATRFRPDLSLYQKLLVALDSSAPECPPLLAPLIDPNLHSCGNVRHNNAVERAHPELCFWNAG